MFVRPCVVANSRVSVRFTHCTRAAAGRAPAARRLPRLPTRLAGVVFHLRRRAVERAIATLALLAAAFINWITLQVWARSVAEDTINSYQCKFTTDRGCAQ
ncbi:hypothetical protein EVAR_88162_1 [Eumeta japonica]|uniref:Uncharacterized protein n=1 Tax=Eumeta variegata TaxID=151549 RepID=A0A4C1WCA8_EUMVA|nr:hypothetical protein EVAR_88162_1 [Eumeta japonica]